MKLIYRIISALVVSLVLLPTLSSLAQSPDRLSYQAVIRDADDKLLSETQVGMKVSILQGSTSGSAVYIETHTPTSNINGLVSVEIGGGNVVEGVFSLIDWANSPFFLKVETDLNGGSNYSITSVSQLLSVPYSLFSKKSNLAAISEFAMSADYESLINKPLAAASVVPLSAQRGYSFTVSFSGGDELSFTQASATCPELQAAVMLSFTQGTPTFIYPVNRIYVNSKRFDAVFQIPWNTPTGVYDIILSPYSSCPHVLETNFVIF